ncbi:unnamed protein product, partial [marine sediment metagenome]
MTIAPFEIENNDLDLLTKSIEIVDNNNKDFDLLAKALDYKEKTIAKTNEKDIEKTPIYSYPDYYNIFPCYIDPHLNEKGEKITKFPLKWEKLMTEKYPKAKLLQDIQTFN